MVSTDEVNSSVTAAAIPTGKKSLKCHQSLLWTQGSSKLLVKLVFHSYFY